MFDLNYMTDYNYICGINQMADHSLLMLKRIIHCHGKRNTDYENTI